MEIFKDFHANGILNKVVNSTYIALITKKEKCSLASNYRSSSLTTSLYKLIAKVLAERLKSTLPDTIISENQMAFVRERQITYAILITNEVGNFWKIKKTKGFVSKLDIKKAFNKINWTFIDLMLLKNGFSHKWRNWIKSCISSVQYSIMINEKSRGKIQSTRGIRQGDPISPFIFVIIMDYFGSLLNFLKTQQKIKGVRINEGQSLTHLLFADEILLFIRWWWFDWEYEKCCTSVWIGFSLNINLNPIS